MIKAIDGALYLKMLSAGAARLSERKQEVNDLNVFPIPDGDTGSNMLMTMEGGIFVEPQKEIGQTAKAVSNGMLLGARGNSGVILSRIFSGIAKGLKGIDECGLSGFAGALKTGVSESYRSVARPVEGTILTVFREGVEYAEKMRYDGEGFEEYFRDLTDEFGRSLERTPDLLAVLRESGVVDSGGAGLVLIFKGMFDALKGIEISHEASAEKKKKNIDLSLFTEDSELTFGYCTEFLLRLQNSKVDIAHFDLEALIAHLNSVGDSVAAFIEGSIVKVHVHTLRPGEILNYCQRFGEFLTLKIENMTLQHNETLEKKDESFKRVKVKKPFGIVAAASGERMRETFISLGCDAVVNGGQSMNPSTEDFIDAFGETAADTILVYPNNGNVILAAKQAAELYEDAKIVIIPTKSVGEGYAAISMLDTSSGDVDTILAEQKDIIDNVVTGFVSRAVRDTERDGVAVRKDDYIGFVGDKILVDDRSREDTLLMLSEKLNAGKYDIMLLIYGEGVSDAEAEEAARRLNESFRRLEIVPICGGQPVYDYITVLE